MATRRTGGTKTSSGTARTKTGRGTAKSKTGRGTARTKTNTGTAGTQTGFGTAGTRRAAPRRGPPPAAGGHEPRERTERPRSAHARDAASGWSGIAVDAVGHSTRPLDEFLALLREFDVQEVVDIRTIPRSRRNPQYDASSLPTSLERAGIAYRHLPALGGLRHGLGRASPNGAWRNASFRGYADHMLSDEFARGLEELRELARERHVALLCAEAVPWRCHRSLVADALTVRGAQVRQLLAPKKASPHRLTPFARVSPGGQLTYPPGDAPSPA